MAVKDLRNHLTLCHMIDPQDIGSTDTVSNILDLQNADSNVIMAIVGAITGISGSNYLTPTLQESTTTVGTDFSDVGSSDIIGSFTKIDASDEDQTTQIVQYTGSERYVRINFECTGSASATLIAAVGLLGNIRHSPTATVTAITAT